MAKAKIKEGIAKRLRYPDDSFDLVLSPSSLHYYSEPAKAIKEMARVLKPGGSVVILDWNRDYYFKLYNLLKEKTDSAHGRIYTADEIAAFMRNAGLSILLQQRKQGGFWRLLKVKGRKPRSNGKFSPPPTPPLSFNTLTPLESEKKP